MRHISIIVIDRAVAERLGPARVAGNAQPAALNRQIAMYLARRVGGWSLTKIGKFYNGRHHTTVRYAVRRIEELRAANPEVDSLLQMLTQEIKSSLVPNPNPQIHLRQPVPSRVPWPAIITEEAVNALVDRLVARLTSAVDEVLTARLLDRDSFRRAD